MADDKKEVVVPEKFKDLVEKIEKLTVLDLSELVKVLEEKFGVSGAMMAAAPAAAGVAAAAPAEEKTDVDVVLKDAGAAKIQIIKIVKETLNIGLKEAKDLVDKAPATLKQGMKKEEAEAFMKKLAEGGAIVELK